jgi:hypothetical protein
MYTENVIYIHICIYVYMYIHVCMYARYVYIYMYIYNWVLFIHKEVWNYVIFRKINGTEYHDAQCNKPDWERQISHLFFHMQNVGLKKTWK